MEYVSLGEDTGTTIYVQHRELLQLRYENLEKLVWDHSSSSLKCVSRSRTFVVDCEDSLELERELKQRLRFVRHQAVQHGRPTPRTPVFEYMGMYASSKPKPFQRKRATLGTTRHGKLPPLAQMRVLALSKHRGSGKPVPGALSRRMKLFREHIHHGTQTFRVRKLSGLIGVASEGVILVLDSSRLRFETRGGGGGAPAWEARWAQVADYRVHDRSHRGESGGNGVGFVIGHQAEEAEGAEQEVLCVVDDVRSLMHTVEHFFNAALEERSAAAAAPGRGQQPFVAKPKSTHGRRVMAVHTLTGESPPPPVPKGNKDAITDVVGTPIATSRSRRGAQGHGGGGGSSSGSRNGEAMAAISSTAVERRGSSAAAAASVAFASPHRAGKSWKLLDTATPVSGAVRENAAVARHWDSLCVHQGWLLKRGGLSWRWQKRYAVLYRTAQGHFLCYYSDFATSPLFSAHEEERNVIDLCRATFIRPHSAMREAPRFAFDVCTIDREWTLCPETRGEQQTWLQLLSRAVDEDAAITPDDLVEFDVKARFDPSHTLQLHQYSTKLRVSAGGVSVAAHRNGEWGEVMFWCYTDFFKWSIVSHEGKTGVQLSVFTGDDFDSSTRREFVFRSRQAHQVAATIEFYIEKFMGVMNLWLEGEEESPRGRESSRESAQANSSTAAPPSRDGGDAMRLDTNAASYQEGDEDLLISLDTVEEEKEEEAPPGCSSSWSTAMPWSQEEGGVAGALEVVVPRVCEEVVPTVVPRVEPHTVVGPHAVVVLPAAASASKPQPSGETPVEASATAAATTGAAATLAVSGVGGLGSPSPSSGTTPAAASLSNAPPPPVAAGAATNPFSDLANDLADLYSCSLKGDLAAGKSGDKPVRGAATAAAAGAAATKGAAASAAATIAPSPAPPVEDVKDLFWKASTESSGLLFRDHLVSVELVQQEHRGSQARLFFQVSSVRLPAMHSSSSSSSSSSSFGLSLVNLSASIGLRGIPDQALRLELQPAPRVLETGGSFRVCLLLECMQPFSGVPSLDLSFTAGAEPQTRAVPFPLSLLKFVEPAASLGGAQAVEGRWRELGARPELEARDAFPTSLCRAIATASPPSPVSAADVAALLAAFSKVGVVEFGGRAYAFGTLHTGTPSKTGSKISVGCIIEITVLVQEKEISVAVRSPLPSVSRYLLECTRKTLSSESFFT